MNRLKELFTDWRYMKFSLFIAFTVALLYILYFLIKNIGSVLTVTLSILGSVLTALSPLFIGLVLAYLLSPLVAVVDTKIASRIFFKLPKNQKKAEKQLQMRRTLSIILTYILILVLVVLLIYAFAFLIVGQLVFTGLTNVLESIVTYFSHYEEVFLNFIETLPSNGLEDRFDTLINDIAQWISKNFSAEAVLGFMARIGGSLVNVALGIVVSIYLIKDSDFFKRLWRKALHVIFPMKHGAKVNDFLNDMDMVFSKFLRGQLLDALIVAIIVSVVLTVIRLDFAVLLGCFAGLTNVIPYFGPIFGAVPAVIVALFTGGLSKAIITLIVFVVIQQIDGNLIYPKVVGTSTGLHPVFVLLAVTFGGYFWGLLGMVLAVPVTACLKLFILRKAGELE
ncbi:MAG TPA: AI-2E family transporter [Bacillota bacterium]|nr:AI-2E family transporter [Bacillota bacterium]